MGHYNSGPDFAEEYYHERGEELALWRAIHRLGDGLAWGV